MIRISQIGKGSTWHLFVEGTLSDGWVDALETSWLEAQLGRNRGATANRCASTCRASPISTTKDATSSLESSAAALKFALRGL